MLKARMVLRGEQELVNRLNKISKTISGPVLSAAGGAAATIVEDEVLRRTPVYTGRLRRSMGTGVGVEPEGIVRIWIGPREGYEEWERGRLQDPARYGEIIEERGTPIGRARGFMTRSATAAAPKVRDTVVTILRAALEGMGT